MNKNDTLAAYSDFTKWCRDNPHLDLDSRPHSHGGPIGDGGYISDEKTRVAFAAWRAAIEADRKRTAELLKNPVHVHSNMCRRIIAPITFDMLAHALGEEATNEWLRKRRGEPVAWRYLTPTGWHATTDAARALGVAEHHTVEPLYTAPQPAEPDRGAPVPKGWKIVPETPTSKQIVHMALQIKGADADGWFRTDGDDWPEHVDAAERAYKWALSEAPQPPEPTDKDSLSVAAPVACFKCGHTKHDGECVNVAPQPAEPVNAGWCEGCTPDDCCGCGPHKPAEPVKVQSMRELIADYAYAATFQSVGQYRRALLARYGSTTDEATKQQQKIEESMRRSARLADRRFKI